jgi:hypothetical protein
MACDLVYVGGSRLFGRRGRWLFLKRSNPNGGFCAVTVNGDLSEVARSHAKMSIAKSSTRSSFGQAQQENIGVSLGPIDTW